MEAVSAVSPPGDHIKQGDTTPQLMMATAKLLLFVQVILLACGVAVAHIGNDVFWGACLALPNFYVVQFGLGFHS
jgi:hypothetical protein